MSRSYRSPSSSIPPRPWAGSRSISFSRSPSSNARSLPSAFATRSRPPSARVCGSAGWCRSATMPRTARSGSTKPRPSWCGSFTVAILSLAASRPSLADLRQQGIVSKLRTLKSDKIVGGMPFARGGLSYLLRNRFYLGEVAFKGEVLPGEQLAILDRELFDAVQVKLSEQKNNHQTLRTTSNALLMGRLFDDRGNGMTPSHTCKQGVRYRYYLSSGLLQGQAERPGSVHRVAATEIENVVIQSVRDHVKPPEAVEDRGLVEAYVERIEIRPDRLIVGLNQPKAADGSQPEGTNTLHIPWSKTPPTRRREILLPADPSQQRPWPIRSETKATLIAAIAQGRRWLKELIEDPAATTESIANRTGCSARKVNMTISLAFLAPDLVKAAIDGHLPHGLGIARLCDLPIEWARQHEIIGLAAY